jgi:hypothetical protein
MVQHTTRIDYQQSNDLLGKHGRNRFWSQNSTENHEDFEGLVQDLFGAPYPPIPEAAVGSDPTPYKPEHSCLSNTYPKAIQQVAASKTPLSQADNESHVTAARSYRKETADLIKQLDAMLLYGNPDGKTNNKRKRKKSVENQARPRSRNVVLKQAADMIWKVQCDEEVLATYKLFVHFGFHDARYSFADTSNPRRPTPNSFRRTVRHSWLVTRMG